MLKHFEKKLWKLMKNPKLLIQTVIFWYYRYRYRDIFKLPLNCEGLISSPEAVYLYKTILRIRRKKGIILDFGSYKGLSGCILSRAGMKIGKSVVAFESFQGLPPPEEVEKNLFKEGEYKAAKIDFEKNIDKWGKSENVELIIGDCRETLNEEIKTKRITEYSFAFIDVDIYAVIKNILHQLDTISRGGEVICIHDIHSKGVQTAIKEFVALSKHRVDACNISRTYIAKLNILRSKGRKMKNSSEKQYANRSLS